MKVTNTVRKVINYVYFYSFLLIGMGFILGLSASRQSVGDQLTLLLLEAALIAVLMFSAHRWLAPWTLGAMGETVVRGLIKDMYRAGVRGIEDVRYDNGGKANIDHVAVAPSGVWVIEVKYWDGQVSCENGKLVRRGKPIGGKILEGCNVAAKRVRKILQDSGLPAPVRPLLVFAREKVTVTEGKNLCNNVLVIGRSWLRKILVEDGPNDILTPAEVEAIHKKLTESSLI